MKAHRAARPVIVLLVGALLAVLAGTTHTLYNEHTAWAHRHDLAA